MKRPRILSKSLTPIFVRSLAVLAACSALPAWADVRLPVIFGDHMVLQRDQKVPVWGWADAGEKVTVEFAGQTAAATAKDGKWSLTLPALKTNSTGAVFTVKGKNTIELKDVLVGEVWFCSGQSNMEMTVGGSKGAKEEIAVAKNPRIRHFKVPHVTDVTPQTEVKTSGGWLETTPGTVGGFTAAGYYFAKEIEKEVDVPVGLIGCNWGGTRIDPWIPPAGWQAVPALKENFADKLSTFPARTPVTETYTQPVLDTDGKPTFDASGKPNVVTVTETNGRPKQRPKLDAEGKPIFTAGNGSPMAIYNAMVHPIIPYAIRGALWYQGESNNGEGMLYFEKMKALVAGWRALWEQGDFPFYYVQLAPYRYGRPEALPGIWEAQAASLAIPNSGMAVITDVSTVRDIHPPDKTTVGHRLALWALAKTYQKPVAAYASPIYDSLKIEGNQIRVTLKNSEGLKSNDGQELTWFTIAGADKKFVEAKAAVAGNSVVVSASGIDKPVAVRFGWHELAEPNLVNGAGLPASPFRTDAWTDATIPVFTLPEPQKK